MYVYAEEAAEVASRFVGKLNDAIFFPLIQLMLGIALLLFLWGALQYVANANNPEGREKGKKHLIYGVIGMLIMISALAILTIVANTFDLPIP